MLKDTITLTGRTLKHVTRSFDTIITTAMMPIAFLLLFVYVFGGAIKQSLGEGEAYINYLLPGILVMTIASGVSYVGYRIFEDKQKGMFSRIKTMSIKAGSFLWAHVIVSLVANFISLIIVVGIALIMGARIYADMGQWGMIILIVFLLTLSLTWFMVIPGLLAKTMTGASVLAYPLMFLPMLSSGFVPTTDMLGPVRWFAENQPVTAISDALRSLMAGHSPKEELWTAIVWLLLILVIAQIISQVIYKQAK